MTRKPTSTIKPKQLSVREKEGFYVAPQSLPRNKQFDLLTSDQLKEVSTFARVANQGYAICICNIPRLREDLIIGLKEDLKSEGIGLYQLRLRSGDRSLGAKIRTLLQDEDFFQFRNKYQKVILSIVGLDDAIQEKEKKFEKRPEALQGLNQQRDYLRTLSSPLLIWVPEWLSAKFPEFAPDFWVARSVVFECTTPSEMVKQSLSQLLGVEVTFKDLSEAKRKMRIYEKLIKSSEDMFIKAFALLNLGILHQMQGGYSEAEKLYQQSLRITEELGDKSGIARSLHQLGMIKQDTGAYKEAETLYRESLKIEEELGDKSGVAGSLHELGRIKQATGDYFEAERLYQQSLKIAEELGDKSGISSTLHQLGIIKEDTGEYTEAEKLYQRSLKIAEDLGDKSGIASSLHQLGNINYLKGEYPEAERLYQQSLKIREELGDKSGVASSLHQLGMIKHDQGNYTGADKIYRQSLKIREELGDKSGISRGLHQLGRIKHAMGDYSEAEKLYRESLKIREELGDKSGIASSLGQLGRLADIRGENESALRYYVNALRIFEELNSPYVKVAHQDIDRMKVKLGEAKSRELYEIVQSQMKKA